MMISATQVTNANTPQQTFEAGASQTGNKTVDYDAFLQLLVSQLKTQDPTNPTDSAEFFSQLASFSSVEQQIQINSKLESLLTSSQLGEATNLIGKTITFGENDSGVVKSVFLNSSGNLIAKLEDDRLVEISDGIEIGEGKSPIKENIWPTNE